MLPTRLPAGSAVLSLLLSFACTETTNNESGFFVERAKTSGIDFVHHHGGSGKKHLVEIVAGSVCLLDYDQDGDSDIAFGQGTALPGTDPSSFDSRDRLYRNDGRWNFTDVTEDTRAFEPGYTLAIVAPDFDGDGDQDLYFCNFGENRMLRNDDGVFTDVTAEVGLNSARFTTGAAFADFDQDGDLDAYLCNYVIEDLKHPGCGDTQRGAEYRTYCEPGVFPASPDQMFENLNGRFVDVTERAGIVDTYGNSLGVVISDYDLDGDVDVFVANDQSPNFLWTNQGGFRFRNDADRAGVAVGGMGASEACMGTDWGDVDQDGDFDLIAANLAMETNTLYVNDGDGFFSDRSEISGIGVPSLPNVGFGCELFDADNDSDLDLMVVNGQVIDNVHLYEPLATFEQPPQFYENNGEGRFADVSASAGPYFSQRYVGRALAVGDLDGDGDLDAVVSNNNRAAHLLENQRSQNRSWIRFVLKGAQKNTAALGARVEVTFGKTTLNEELRGTSSYASFHELVVHFGLDDVETVNTVRVFWPDGATSEVNDLGARQVHVLEHPNR